METTIPAAIVVALLMIAATVVARAGYQTVDSLGQAWKAMESRSVEQAHTELSITSATHSAGIVDVAILNSGDTRLAAFDSMDVVVEYTDSTPTFMVAYIDYTDGALTQNTWVVQSIANDAFEPGIVNPGETLNMRISLNPAPGGGTTNRLLIATEQGVTVTTTFTG